MTGPAWTDGGRSDGMTASTSPEAGRGNLITPLRLVLATLVAFSHSFALTGTTEPIAALSDDHIGLGTIAVYAFFGLSGVLVTASGDRLGRGRFVWHRFLRLYPAFWLCLVVTAAVVAGAGPATAAEAVRYIASNITTVINTGSVAGEPYGTAYPNALNGSLWTLAPEVGCYLLVALVGRGRWWSPVMFLGLLALLTLPIGARNEIHLGMAFAAGAFVYRFRVPTGQIVTAGAGVLLALAILGHAREFVSLPAVVLLAVGLGRLPGRWRLPDLSYGTYLYAFPVGQGFVTLGVRDPLLLFSATMAAVLPLAAISWYVVEKPALGLKPLARPTWLRSTRETPVPAE